MNLDLFRHIFEKCLNIKFNKNPSAVIRVVSCGQMDRQT
jgi:hypothetical protein